MYTPKIRGYEPSKKLIAFENQLLELYSGDSAAAIEYMADVFDKLGNEYVVSAADVGAALIKCTSVLDTARNSIQQSSGMATALTEVLQNAEIAGSTLKILAMRLRGTTAAELEEIGEDTVAGKQRAAGRSFIILRQGDSCNVRFHGFCSKCRLFLFCKK